MSDKRPDAYQRALDAWNKAHMAKDVAAQTLRELEARRCDRCDRDAELAELAERAATIKAGRLHRLINTIRKILL